MMSDAAPQPVLQPLQWEPVEKIQDDASSTNTADVTSPFDRRDSGLRLVG